MSWPQPTRQDHERFCLAEGWDRVRDARGHTDTHHVTYEFDLPDGRILRTRISHPVDHSDYGRDLWTHILRDQLQVSEREFWVCVKDAVMPNRGVPQPPPEALPAEVVHLLITRGRLDEAQVRTMSRDEAIARLQRFWAEGQ